jgi:hypothetical protein
MHHFGPLTVLLLGLLAVSTAQAASLRCGSALITRDDSTQEVLSKCGEPISRDFLGYRERLDIYGFHNEIAVEEWTYGPRNGMYHFLRFEAGRLVSIGSKRGN